ncbi:MAG: hypothetical protein OXS30_03870 [Chloroflexota bacterium]|nr:hypothetical protein [Chloroflexota bacterium]
MADKPKLGRPPKPIPEPVDDSPENVAKALFNTKPKRKDEWKYLKEERKDG